MESSSGSVPSIAGHAARDRFIDCKPPSILTRIVATIGPTSETPEIVARLIEAGVSIFRLNFSHGDLAAHARRLAVVREVAAELDRPIAALGDLQGPKIRVGKVPDGGIMLEPGQEVVIHRDLSLAYTDPASAGAGSERRPGTAHFPTTYPQMIDEVEPGHRLLINDGLIRMLSVDSDRTKGELRCRVTVGGLVTSSKGINLPESELSAPAITDRDWECVAWAVDNAIDFLALSFVRRPEEIAQLRERLSSLCPIDRLKDPHGETATIPIVAKIEMPQALKNLDAIVDESDAIMVARGDLGVEMDIAQVPIAQKRIIAAAARAGRPCIVATQMLESMIENSSPTRAEATDVANAIFDGADAVMLSAETAAGKHPVLVVETMRRIVAAAEEHLRSLPAASAAPSRLLQGHETIAAIAHGVWRIATDIGAKCVVCWSQRGGAARYLSQNNLNIPIIAYSSSARATRRMSILRGVIGINCRPPKSGLLADWNLEVDRYLQRTGIAKPGDRIVLVAGKPLGVPKVVNLLAVHTVGDPTTGFLAGDVPVMPPAAGSAKRG